MLNKLYGQKQLLKEVSDRLDDCDEFLLLRAFKRMSNTEISALVSGLPVHHSNQMLIILPNEVTRRVMAQGFVPRDLDNEILRKLIGMIDRELELDRVKQVVTDKADSTDRYIGNQLEPQEIVAQEPVLDAEIPASVRILDIFGRFVSNTFKK
jgi:hypothetical protein